MNADRTPTVDWKAVPSDCALTHLVREAAALAAALPAAADRPIQTQPGDATAVLFTDREALTRVLLEMLRNALEAEPAGTTIAVGWDATLGGGAEIWVRNPAVMASEVQERVFLLGYSTKRDGRGAGRGTEFRVRLPARLKRAAQPGLSESSNL